MKIINLVLILMCALQTYGCNRNDSIESVSAKDFEKEIGKGDVQVLDVRTPQEYDEGYIDGAININVQSDDFRQKAKQELSKDQPVLVYCRSGRRSMDAAEILTDLGYKVINLRGGILEWESSSLPIQTSPNPK